MSDKAMLLHSELNDAVLAAVERLGPTGFDRAALVRQFSDRGASRATLYRWLSEILASGQPAAHFKTRVTEAVATRAERSADPASEAAREAVRVLPAPLDVAAAIALAAPETGVPFLDELKGCLTRAHKMVDHALAEDGKLRNAKLFLQGSEHIRRTIETLARVQDSLLEIEHIKRYHDAMFDALRKESPEVAERILICLRQLNLAWSVG